jgi:hypothetical protein
VETPVIPVLGRQKQEDWELHSSQDCIARPYLKTKQRQTKRKKEKPTTKREKKKNRYKSLIKELVFGGEQSIGCMPSSHHCRVGGH